MANRDQTKREGNSEPGRKQSAKATRNQDPGSGDGRVRMGKNQARGDGVRKSAPKGYRGCY